MAGPGPLPGDRKVAFLIELVGPKSEEEKQKFDADLEALKTKYGVKIRYKVKGFKE